MRLRRIPARPAQLKNRSWNATVNIVNFVNFLPDNYLPFVVADPTVLRLLRNTVATSAGRAESVVGELSETPSITRWRVFDELGRQVLHGDRMLLERTTSVSTTMVLMRRDRICHAHATAEERPGTPRLARPLAKGRLAEWDRESALFAVGQLVHPLSDWRKSRGGDDWTFPLPYPYREYTKPAALLRPFV